MRFGHHQAGGDQGDIGAIDQLDGFPDDELLIRRIDTALSRARCE